MHLRYLLALSLLILVAAACRTDAEPVPDPETATPSLEPTVGESPLSPPATPTREPTVGESPLSPPATPTPVPPGYGDSPLPEPGSPPIATPAGPAGAVVAAAREHLADQLEIPTQQVELLLVERVEWSDASLGCPEPGKAYAQVITPGYRVVLRVGEREYELHTDQSARRIVICKGKGEEGSGAALEHLVAALSPTRPPASQ